MNATFQNPVARLHLRSTLWPVVIALVLVCALLGSCSRTPSSQNESGDDRPLISTDETRQVGMHVLLNRYPDAKIISEQGEGQIWKYRFTTNGTTVAVVLVVDRRAAKAKFENLPR